VAHHFAPSDRDDQDGHATFRAPVGQFGEASLPALAGRRFLEDLIAAFESELRAVNASRGTRTPAA
jgi:hypothetical protein